MGDDALTVGGGALGVHNTLGDALTGEVSQLVNQVKVSQDNGAAWTSGHGVLVVVDRGALRVGNDGSLHV